MRQRFVLFFGALLTALCLLCASTFASEALLGPSYLTLVGARTHTAGRFCEATEPCTQWAWWDQPDGTFRLYHSGSAWEPASRYYEQFRETPEFIMLDGWTPYGEQGFYEIHAQDVWVWTEALGWVDRTAEFRHGPIPYVHTFLGEHHKIWVRVRLWDTVSGGWIAQYQDYKEWQLAPITTFYFGQQPGLLGYETFEYIDRPHGAGPTRFDSVIAHVSGVMFAWSFGWFDQQPLTSAGPSGTKYVWQW